MPYLPYWIPKEHLSKLPNRISLKQQQQVTIPSYTHSHDPWNHKNSPVHSMPKTSNPIMDSATALDREQHIISWAFIVNTLSMYNKAAKLHHLSTDAGVWENAGKRKEKMQPRYIWNGRKVYKISPRLDWQNFRKNVNATAVCRESMKECRSRVVHRARTGQNSLFSLHTFCTSWKDPTKPNCERQEKKSLCHQASWRERLYTEAAR